LELIMELMGVKPFNPKMLAERVGFESALKRRSNNMQGYGWQS